MKLPQLPESMDPSKLLKTDALSGLNLAAPSWDLFILIFFVVAVFIYGFALGRNRIVVILVAVYMALAVVNTAPFVDSWVERAMSVGSFTQAFGFKIALFLIIFALLFFLFSRSTLLRNVTGSERSGAWWQVPIFSVLHIGLLLSIALSFLPKDITMQLAPLTREVFTSEVGRFVWITAPIAAMIILPE
jgi:hypothetical protein